MDGIAPVVSPAIKLLHSILAPILRSAAPVAAPVLNPVASLTGQELKDPDALTRPLTGQGGPGGGVLAALLDPLGASPLTGKSGDPYSQPGSDALPILPSVPTLLSTPLSLSASAPQGVAGVLKGIADGSTAQGLLDGSALDNSHDEFEERAFAEETE